jgi:hypothetical protein
MADVNEKLLNGAGLAELWSLIKESDVDVREYIEGLLGSYTKFQTGSYTGHGSYGQSNPNTLTFNFVPKFLFVMAAPGSTGTNHPYIIAQPDRFTTTYKSPAYAGYGGVAIGSAKLEGTTFSWFSSPSGNTPGPTNQCSTAIKWNWVAIG